MENLKEVYFDEYCSRCIHCEQEEFDDPCHECLNTPANECSHKPIYFEEDKK